MPLYRYSATHKDGSRYEGQKEAADKVALYRDIRAEGGIVLSTHEVSRGFSFSLTLFESVSNADKIAFTRNLSSMLKAGLSLSRGLAILSKQTKSKLLKRTITEMEEEIRKGSPFHEALKRYPALFPPLMVSMVRAGEESGSLADSLGVVGVQLERAYSLKKKVRGAMIYPAIVVVVMIGIAILMLMYVVPSLSATFGELGVELPRSTQAIIGASNALQNHSLLLLLSALFLGGAVYAGARTSLGKTVLHRLALLIPIIGTIVKEVNTARTARSLSSLLSAGVSALSALSITRDIVQNVHYKKVIAEAETLVEKGFPFSEAFARHEDIYPVIFSEMIAVGEETGQLSQMLLNVADFYEDEVEQKTKDMSTVIEPFLMVLIGSGVGFFAISMISPIYSLSSGI
jgi:type IV pilus assembly protein PilC